MSFTLNFIHPRCAKCALDVFSRVSIITYIFQQNFFIIMYGDVILMNYRTILDCWDMYDNVIPGIPGLRHKVQERV